MDIGCIHVVHPRNPATSKQLEEVLPSYTSSTKIKRLVLATSTPKPAKTSSNYFQLLNFDHSPTFLPINTEVVIPISTIVFAKLRGEGGRTTNCCVLTVAYGSAATSFILISFFYIHMDFINNPSP